MTTTKSLAGWMATLALMTSLPASGITMTDTESYTVNTAIRDNDLNGLADTQTFLSPIKSIDSIQVTLDISGGFNGDLYIYLTHGSGFSVLLNRPGRTASDDYGYWDSGFNVTFSGDAANGDIHNYQSQVNPLGGSLTGVWQPDGRETSPLGVVDTDSRTALFDSFTGLNPDGEWTLFVADVSSVGTATLNSWELSVTGKVPDGGVTLGFLAFGTGAVMLLRRYRSWF